LMVKLRPSEAPQLNVAYRILPEAEPNTNKGNMIRAIFILKPGFWPNAAPLVRPWISTRERTAG